MIQDFVDFLLPERCNNCQKIIFECVCPRKFIIFPSYCKRCGFPSLMPVERCTFCYRKRISFSSAVSCGLLLEIKQSNLELNTMECSSLGRLLAKRLSKIISDNSNEIFVFYESTKGFRQFVEELEKKGFKLHIFNLKDRSKIKRVEVALLYQFFSKRRLEVNRKSLFLKRIHKPRKIVAAMCLVSREYYK